MKTTCNCVIQGCKCENFLYMYRRPEEIGQYYLTRRKGEVFLKLITKISNLQSYIRRFKLLETLKDFKVNLFFYRLI